MSSPAHLPMSAAAYSPHLLSISSSSSSALADDSHMHDIDSADSDHLDKESSKASSAQQAPVAEILDLPHSCITKIVKSCIPANFQLQRDVRSQFAKAGAIFVLYLMHSANEFTEAAGRSSITSTDVLSALEEMDFEALLPTLNEFLRHYQKENSTRGGAIRTETKSAPKGKPGRKKKVQQNNNPRARNGEKKSKEAKEKNGEESRVAAAVESEDSMAVETGTMEAAHEDFGQHIQHDMPPLMHENDPAIHTTND